MNLTTFSCLRRVIQTSYLSIAIQSKEGNIHGIMLLPKTFKKLHPFVMFYDLRHISILNTTRSCRSKQEDFQKVFSKNIVKSISGIKKPNSKLIFFWTN